MKKNKRKYSYVFIFMLCMFFCLASSIRASADEDVQPVYKIMVNRAANCITVYEKGEEGKSDIPVKAFVCSVGRAGHATPLGRFKTSNYYEWRLMVDDSYGRYVVRFNRKIMFHSVPYYTANVGDLEWEQYNLLGEPASLGCVRLTCADAKWIYENCVRGTEVIVYDDAENPGPLGKPSEMKLAAENSMKQWDPTDTGEENPWNLFRPRLYLINGGTDGVLRLPVGTAPEDIYKVIGLMDCNGKVLDKGEYTIRLSGNYDLNTEGVYKVSVCGIETMGIRTERQMLLRVGDF